MSKPRTPAGLKARGARFWREVVGKYELRFDELIVLEECCREIDLIDRLVAECEGSSLRTTGSMGQEVADPMVSELRQHRNTLKGLLASLKLPDEAAGAGEGAAGPTSASSAAIAMNRARWSKSPAAGARGA